MECPSCKRTVSYDAKSCPGCGELEPYSKARDIERRSSDYDAPNPLNMKNLVFAFLSFGGAYFCFTTGAYFSALWLLGIPLAFMGIFYGITWIGAALAGGALILALGASAFILYSIFSWVIQNPY